MHGLLLGSDSVFRVSSQDFFFKVFASEAVISDTKVNDRGVMTSFSSVFTFIVSKKRFEVPAAFQIMRQMLTLLGEIKRQMFHVVNAIFDLSGRLMI